MDELIGQIISKYKIERLLGEGGMGAVYLARDLSLQRPVAFKVMHPEYARQSDSHKRFAIEARAAARLNHPGIVKVYDLGQAGAMVYIVMEYVNGPTLRTKLTELRRKQQQLPAAEVLRLSVQLAHAMAYVHEQEVLHRDLKPANILLRLDRKRPAADLLPYEPVIADLGLAKLQDSELTTWPGKPVGGTPAYMAPEQASGGPVDARSDVYALGLIFYELAVGQRPASGSPPLRTLRPDLPPAFERIILKAIAQIPAQRYPSATALAQALESLTDSAPFVRFTLPFRWQTIGLLLALGLLIGAFAFLFAGGNGNDESGPTGGITMTPTTYAMVLAGTPTVAAESFVRVSATLPTITRSTSVPLPNPLTRSIPSATSSAAPTTTPTFSPTPALPTPTMLVSLADNTSAPSPTLTPSITPRPPTSTPAPTATSVSTATASPTPIPRAPTATKSPVNNPPVTQYEQTYQISPLLQGIEVNGVILIAWQGPPPQLGPTEKIDVVRWLKDKQTFETGQGFVDVNTIKGSSVNVNLDGLNLESGQKYEYAVVVVETNPSWRVVRRVSNVDSFVYRVQSSGDNPPPSGGCTGPLC